MKKALVWVLAAGCVAGSYATDARVITMGRHDGFFMDEVSIFRNPANISIYPNMVYGSYGVYAPVDSLDLRSGSSSMPALERNNRDPVDPFFGAIVSYSLNQGTEGGNQYPMLSLGAVFNRHDEMLDYVTPGALDFKGDSNTVLRDPVGKVDLLVGYALANGGMIGGGTYIAFQKDNLTNPNYELQTNVFKGNLGINLPVAKSMDLEFSLGGGVITAIGLNVTNTDTALHTIADNDWFARLDLRLFSALTSLNGDFVPHFGFKHVRLGEDSIRMTDIAAGIGLNINIDKGFFWAGLEGLYNEAELAANLSPSGIGARVSFGIERNIWWDWFVIRVGGQKEIMYMTNGPEKSNWIENRASDASDNDLVSLGFGLNVENRLRIDFVAAEDLAYTFTNLISGPQHHLFNRVSATYSF